MRLISIGYSFTKKLKIAILTNLGYFGRLLVIPSLFLQNDWIKSIHFLKGISPFKYLPLKIFVSIFCCVVHSA